MKHPALIGLVGLLVLATAAAAAPALDTSPSPELEPAPRDLGLEERVEVQYVMIDTVVLTRNDRTVPGLTIDDFKLVIGGYESEIATLDVHCPAGETRDPRGGQTAADTDLEGLSLPDRKIVLVFDYYHMENAGLTIEQAVAALDNWGLGGEEHMVVTLGEVMSVHVPFTKNVRQVQDGMIEMRRDPLLYAGNYGRLTERRFFDRIHSLMDLLELYPGHKQVVLFSGPFMKDGWDNDDYYKQLGALSASSRVSVYPVDSTGMNSYFNYGWDILGGPEKLRRLAHATGGRMTADNNDLGLGYARAQRDAACKYTIGFYDREPRLDVNRKVYIKVRGNGTARAIHAKSYVIRSEEKRSKSMTRTAGVAPDLFARGGVKTQLFLMGPKTATRWEGTFAVEIDPADPALAGVEGEIELQGKLRSASGAVLHKFRRTVELSDHRDGEPIRIFETVRAKPGWHSANVVLTLPRSSTPLAASKRIGIPKVPQETMFVVAPIVGTESDESGAFEPWVDPEAAQGAPLTSVTQVCYVGDDGAHAGEMIGRVVRAEDGAAAQSFETVPVKLEGKGLVRCQRQLDRLATAEFAPGAYDVTAFSANEYVMLNADQAPLTILPASRPGPAVP